MVPLVETGNHFLGKTVDNRSPQALQGRTKVARSSRPKSHVTRSETVSLQDRHFVHSADFGLVATKVLVRGESPLARGMIRRLFE